VEYLIQPAIQVFLLAVLFCVAGLALRVRWRFASAGVESEAELVGSAESQSTSAIKIGLVLLAFAVILGILDRLGLLDRPATQQSERPPLGITPAPTAPPTAAAPVSLPAAAATETPLVLTTTSTNTPTPTVSLTPVPPTATLTATPRPPTSTLTAAERCQVVFGEADARFNAYDWKGVIQLVERFADAPDDDRCREKLYSARVNLGVALFRGGDVRGATEQWEVAAGIAPTRKGRGTRLAN
jgi:hypothetical protein